MKKLKKSALKMALNESDDSDLLALNALTRNPTVKTKKENKSIGVKHQRVRGASTASTESGMSSVSVVESVNIELVSKNTEVTKRDSASDITHDERTFELVESKTPTEKTEVISSWTRSETILPRTLTTSPQRINSTSSIISLRRSPISRNTSSQSLASLSTSSTESALNHTIVVLMQSLLSLQKTAKCDAGKIRGMVCQITLLQQGVRDGMERNRVLEAEIAARELLEYEKSGEEETAGNTEQLGLYYGEVEDTVKEEDVVSQKSMIAVDSGVGLGLGDSAINLF